MEAYPTASLSSCLFIDLPALEVISFTYFLLSTFLLIYIPAYQPTRLSTGTLTVSTCLLIYRTNLYQPA
jgi:hypothetical protein